jgi:hypothetical protein
MAASAGGLLLSATVGFLGIHDGLGVPWAATSLTVELIGVVLLGGAGIVALFNHPLEHEEPTAPARAEEATGDVEAAPDRVD